MNGNKANLALDSAMMAKRFFEGVVTPVKVTQKTDSPRDIVTEVDRRIEEVLHKKLSSDADVLSEENFRLGKDVFTPNGDVWLIDPLDGTVNFSFGIPLYCSSIGLIRSGEFLTGAVAMLHNNQFFYTNYQGAPYRNTTPLLVNDTGTIHDALLCVNLPVKEYGAPVVGELFTLLNSLSRGCLRLGSAAISLCYLAASQLSAVVGINNRLWDVAAGFAIATASGCKLVYTLNPTTLEVSYVIGVSAIVDELLLTLEQNGIQIVNNHSPVELANE